MTICWLGLTNQELLRLSDDELATVPSGEWRARLTRSEFPPAPEWDLEERCEELEIEVDDLQREVDGLLQERSQVQRQAQLNDLQCRKLIKAAAELRAASQSSLALLNVGRTQEAGHHLESALEQLALDAWVEQELEQYRLQKAAYDDCA